MKKLLVILLLPIFLISGCTSSVKDDLINYVNISLPPLTEDEIKAINIFEEALLKDNYTYQSLYTTIDGEVIPKYTDFINRLENISIVTDEVKELHEIYKKAATTKLEGLHILKSGLKKKDNDYVNNYNKIFEKSKTYMDEFYNELDKLINKYNIN